MLGKIQQKVLRIKTKKKFHINIFPGTSGVFFFKVEF